MSPKARHFQTHIQQVEKRPLDEIGTQEEFIIPEDYISLITLLKNIDHSPLGGNDVKIFTNGQDKFDSLFADIANAKKHIHVEYYALLDDEIGKNFKKHSSKKHAKVSKYALFTTASDQEKQKIITKNTEKPVSKPSLFSNWHSLLLAPE